VKNVDPKWVIEPRRLNVAVIVITEVLKTIFKKNRRKRMIMCVPPPLLACRLCEFVYRADHTPSES